MATVADRVGLPELALAAVRRYCETKIPPEHRDEVRMEFDVRGRNVSLFECRPPWDPDAGPEWTRTPVAQLRFDPAGGIWELFCARSSGRWAAYEPAPPTTSVGELLDEIDRDPTGIFWG